MAIYRYRITDSGGRQTAVEYLTDFQYEVTVNGETGEITEADVEVRSIANQSGLWKIHMVFAEVNTGIVLEPLRSTDIVDK